ncbi:MAG TPA: calcium-binding protein [Azospirillaceae bacterium]|nr:calcium-binding protein [Azospirillaceae bacterium]
MTIWIGTAAGETYDNPVLDTYTLYGNGGNDKLHGHNLNDFIDGGTGDDDLFGYDGSDSIHGGDGSDYLLGQNGDDFLYGNAGQDFIYGGAGNDFLDGGAQNRDQFDYLYGGAGNDTYRHDWMDSGYSLIDDASGTDTLQFIASVTADVVAQRFDNDLYIWHEADEADGEINHAVQIKNFFNGSAQGAGMIEILVVGGSTVNAWTAFGQMTNGEIVDLL